MKIEARSIRKNENEKSLVDGNIDDDMGQSVLVQLEQNAIWREEQQLCNTTEETASGGESVKENDINGVTCWRCEYTNEEENSEDSSINNHSNLA